jgi:hypothetical protein
MILDETSRAHLGRFCRSWYQSHSEHNTPVTGIIAKTKRASEVTSYKPTDYKDVRNQVAKLTVCLNLVFTNSVTTHLRTGK